MEHKIEFEKLKEPEDQLAMESVRSNFEKNLCNSLLAEKVRCKLVLHLNLSTCRLVAYQKLICSAPLIYLF